MKIIGLLLLLFATESSLAQTNQATATKAISANQLLTQPLAQYEQAEMIMSQVSIAAGERLPWHWHPGEEFAYVMEGSVTLLQDGKPDQTSHPGDAVMIPAKQIHAAVAGPDGVSIVVFRIHKSGEPERVLVEK